MLVWRKPQYFMSQHINEYVAICNDMYLPYNWQIWTRNDDRCLFFQDIENYQLQQIYSHKLSRSAFSISVGPFGRVKNRDFICVQSIDGTLNLFEQESFSFSRFLPGFLLPGPIDYARRTDSFVTVSSSHQLESFRFESQYILFLNIWANLHLGEIHPRLFLWIQKRKVYAPCT